MNENVADYEIHKYTVLRIWPQFEPWIRWDVRWKAFWWIVGATLCLLPGALWNHYHSTMRGTPREFYWLEIGCNDKRWFRI